MADKVIKETTTRETVAATDKNTAAEPDAGTNIAARIIWFIAGLIILLLSFRFLLSLLGANKSNAFADFIYDASYPFVSPFFGLFSYDNINYGVSRFELYTLVAILVYAAIAWGLTYLVTIKDRR